MNENIERKRGRRIIKKNKAVSKTITLYDDNFDNLMENQIELSEFARWLITNKQNEYLEQPSERDYKGGSQQTTISLYPEELENINEKIMKGYFSNFLRWGIDKYIDTYKNEVLGQA